MTRLKKYLRRALALVAAVGLVLSLSPALSIQAAVRPANPWLRIGMLHNSGPRPASVLSAEYGFAYGYLTDSFEFTEILSLPSATYVAAAMDETVYFGSDGKVNDTGNGQPLYGFHVQFVRQFSTQQDARAFMNMLTASQLYPAWVNGVFYVRQGAYASYEAAAAAAQALSASCGVNASAVGGSPTCVTVFDLNRGNVPVFAYDSPTTLALAPLQTPGQPQAYIGWGSYRLPGYWECLRLDGGKVTPINVVQMQDYLKGVLAMEIGPNAPMEALKAQTIVSRSLAFYWDGRHEKSGYDICTTSNCQIYAGVEKQNANVIAAVDETYGEVVKYNGAHVPAFYYASAGGKNTEAIENVWGGYAYPHLRSVYSGYEDPDISYTEWELTYTPQQLGDLLREREYDVVGPVVDAVVTQRTPDGDHAYAVSVTDSTGRVAVSVQRCDRVRSLFNLRSSNYAIGILYHRIAINGGQEQDVQLNTLSVVDGKGTVSAVSARPGELTVLTADGAVKPAEESGYSFVLHGYGWGHGVGMSQDGAITMAKQGMTYRQIMDYYFQDITVERIDQ